MSDLTFAVVVFVALGSFFLFVHLLMGHYIRPNKPEEDKLTIYECGEPTVGSAWVQFDLRYYVVALLFVVFDVEVAFFFPWATVFGTTTQMARQPDEAKRGELMATLQSDRIPAIPRASDAPPLSAEEESGIPSQATAQKWAWVMFADIIVFFSVLMVGFAYLWRRGDISWVKAVTPVRS